MIDNGPALFVVHREKAPSTYEYNALVSFDSVSGERVMLMASNNGGSGRVLRSAGWQGGRLIFQADQRPTFPSISLRRQRFSTHSARQELHAGSQHAGN
jgi:hypothetical protein